MFPGVNPKQMQQMMKKMGMAQKEIDAIEVIIKTETEEIIITDPQVSKINMMGQETYQIVGESHIRERTLDLAEVNEDDIQSIIDQTGCSEEIAKETLIKNNGDLAATILELMDDDSE